MKLFVLCSLPIVLLVGIIAFFIWLRCDKSPEAKRIAARFGVVEADEMERQIQYQAASVGYAVVMCMLGLYNLYVVAVRREPMPLSNLALLAGLFTQCIAVLVLRRRLTAGDEEYKPYPIWKSVLWTVLIAVISILLGSMLTVGVLLW